MLGAGVLRCHLRCMQLRRKVRVPVPSTLQVPTCGDILANWYAPSARCPHGLSVDGKCMLASVFLFCDSGQATA